MRKNSFVAGVFLALAAVSAAAFSDPSKLPQPEFRQIIVGGGALVTGTVATNAELSALSTVYIKKIRRLGFAAAGDAPAVDYVATTAACTIASGAGDGGSQIPSADSKCWNAVFQGDLVSPRIWGCVGDKTANDTVCIQKVINAVQGKRGIALGPYNYKVGAIAATQPITIVGTRKGMQPAGSIVADLQCDSGFTAASSSIANWITIQTYSKLADMCLDADAAGTNTSGVAINLEANCDTTAACPQSTGNIVDNVTIDGPCIGIAASGTYHRITNNYVMRMPGSGCGGIVIGRWTNANRSVGPVISGNIVQGEFGVIPDFGVKIVDAGGPLLTNNQASVAKKGLWLVPGNDLAVNGAQNVQAVNSTSNYWGDTTTEAGIEIDTAGGALGFTNGPSTFTGDWVAPIETAAGVRIRNTAGGGSVVAGLYFNNLRAVNNGSGPAFQIASANVFDVSLVDGHICGGSGTTGVLISAAAARIKIQNSTIGVNCGVATSLLHPIKIDAAGENMTITGNDLAGSTDVAITGLPGEGSLVQNNNGVDNVIPVVASASAITLPINPVVSISGFTTITTINGGFANQKKTLITPDGAISFATGGNIFAAATGPGPLTAQNFGGFWFIK